MFRYFEITRAQCLQWTFTPLDKHEIATLDKANIYLRTKILCTEYRKQTLNKLKTGVTPSELIRAEQWISENIILLFAYATEFTVLQINSLLYSTYYRVR